MAGLLLRLRTWWETADRTQRAVTLFGGAFLVLLLMGTFYFASKPKMTMAFGGLSPSEVGSVTTEIQNLGIPVEFDMQGNVLVPSDKVAEVRAKLAMSGKLPATGHIGNEALEKLPMMLTPSQERERLKAILEGELAQSVESIEGVDSARVHVTLGNTSAFARESKPATASIFVAEAAGEGLRPEAAKAIASLVARAVPGLDPKDVFVLDSSGRSLYQGESASGVALEKIDAETKEALKRENDLQQDLDRAFGRGTTVVNIDLELDFDQTSESRMQRIPNETAAVEQKTNETYSGGGGASGAGAGAGANLGGGTPTDGASAGSDGTYEGKTSMVERPVDEIRSDSVKAAGTLKSMAIAVLADSKKIKNPAPVEQFLQSYIGARASTEPDKFTVRVTTTEFDTTAEDAAAKAAAAASTQDKMQMGISLLPILALVVVAFLVIKAVGKAAKSQTVLVNALPGGAIVRPGAPIPAAAAAGGAQAAAMPSGGGGNSFVGSELARALAAAEGNNAPTPEEIGAIQERLNKPLEQIKRMANDRPESVAMLIKSWLLEERR